jgi:hypothetical protein
MALLHQIEPDRKVHPVDIIEHIASINDWNFERQDDDEISISVRGGWSDYHVSFNWMADLESLHIACAFDLKVPDTRRAEVKALIALVDRALRYVEPRRRGAVPQFPPPLGRRGCLAAAMRGLAALGDRQLRCLLPGVPIRRLGR